MNVDQASKGYLAGAVVVVVGGIIAMAAPSLMPVSIGVMVIGTLLVAAGGYYGLEMQRSRDTAKAAGLCLAGVVLLVIRPFLVNGADSMSTTLGSLLALITLFGALGLAAAGVGSMRRAMGL